MKWLFLNKKIYFLWQLVSSTLDYLLPNYYHCGIICNSIIKWSIRKWICFLTFHIKIQCTTTECFKSHRRYPDKVRCLVFFPQIYFKKSILANNKYIMCTGLQNSMIQMISEKSLVLEWSKLSLIKEGSLKNRIKNILL